MAEPEPPPPTREQVIAQIKHRLRAGWVVCLTWDELKVFLTAPEIDDCQS